MQTPVSSPASAPAGFLHTATQQLLVVEHSSAHTLHLRNASTSTKTFAITQQVQRCVERGELVMLY